MRGWGRPLGSGRYPTDSRTTSSIEVTPSRIFCRPDSRSPIMPFCSAFWRSS